MTTHVTHTAVTTRLKRAAGHLKSIVTMLETERECLEIVQQLQAVEKAIVNAKKTLVRDHIDHCLEQAVRDGSHNSRETIREFQEITKYL
jgi:DNA-binding FrmR family transcriptional regulator